MEGDFPGGWGGRVEKSPREQWRTTAEWKTQCAKNQRKQRDRHPDGTEKGSGQRQAGTPLTVSEGSPSAMVFLDGIIRRWRQVADPCL